MSSTPPTVPWCPSLDYLQKPIPETEWLIDGLLPKRAVVLFSGREGSMKTWLGLAWAYAIAEEGIWLSRVCQSEAVLYMDAEQPPDVFGQRLRVIGGSKNLNVWRWQDPNFPTSLGDQGLLDAAQHHNLIIIDSLKRFMDGLDENNSNDMAIITGQLRKLTTWGTTILVVHHAPKDSTKKGYRGSTELGAGVDVCMYVEKEIISSTQEDLEITVMKTRYHVNPTINLKSTKTPERPIFLEIGTSGASPNAVSDADRQKISVIIEELMASNGTHPNQSEIVQEAQQKGCGSRNTILRRLHDGEGRYWKSQTNGRTRVYEPVHLSQLPISEQMDNTIHTQDQPVQESIPSDSGQVDNSQDESQGPVHLSNSLETEQLDNRTIPDGKSDPSIGSNVYFWDHHLNLGQGVIKDIFEWPGLPEEIVYQTEDGTCFPPSCVSLEGEGEII